MVSGADADLAMWLVILYGMLAFILGTIGMSLVNLFGVYWEINDLEKNEQLLRFAAVTVILVTAMIVYQYTVKEILRRVAH